MLRAPQQHSPEASSSPVSATRRSPQPNDGWIEVGLSQERKFSRPTQRNPKARRISRHHLATFEQHLVGARGSPCVHMDVSVKARPERDIPQGVARPAQNSTHPTCRDARCSQRKSGSDPAPLAHRFETTPKESSHPHAARPSGRMVRMWFDGKAKQE